MFIQYNDENVKTIAFADDTVILASGMTWSDASTKLETALSKIFGYMCTSKLKINAQKSNFMAFAASKLSIPKELSIKIHASGCDKQQCICEEHKRTESTKYLGIIIHQNLKWDCHINYITNKIRRLQYGFKIMAQVCSTKRALQIYHALVESLLSYGLLLWGGSYEKILKPIKIIQKRILKIILHKPKLYPTIQLFNDCKIMNITQLYTLQICKHIFYTDIKLIDHPYQTRAKCRLTTKISKANKTITQSFFINRLPKIYNAMPDNIKKTKSNRSYIRKVKEWIKATI